MADKKDAASGSGKRSLVGTIVEFVVVGAIAAGCGVGIAMMQGGAPPATPPAAGATTKETAPLRTLVDLPPVVTNLASPSDLWVRMEASIVIEGKSWTAPDILAAEIATDELAYLRTLTIGQIEGPVGLENVRQDLADRAAVRSKGAVGELILKTLVLQ